ncbi:MAG: class I SAM-dependent methyltransferase [Mycobacteriales bacterium]
MTEPATGWAGTETATRYATFAASHPMYRETSRDLIARAELHAGSRVLDLCAGTGVTTTALLDALGPQGRVVALDGSAAMLDQARQQVIDPRVTWVQARAEDVADVVPEPCDAVVCNSAIWQTDMSATFAGIRQVLRPGGTFVCNIGRMFLIMPFSKEELQRTKPGLFDLMQAIAVLDHGYVAPGGPRGGRPLTPSGVNELLAATGLVPAKPEVVAYDQSHEQYKAWLKIPIFTERMFPGLAYETRMAILDAAFDRLDKAVPPAPTSWVIFRAKAVA